MTSPLSPALAAHRASIVSQLLQQGVDPTAAAVLLYVARLLVWLRDGGPALAAQIVACTDLLSADRRSALDEYGAAVTDDGVSAQRWAVIADQLAAVADAVRISGIYQPSAYEFLRARAVDAAQRAQYAQRMVVAAREQWGTQCLEVV